MIFGPDTAPLERPRRAIPVALGVAAALVCFGILGWDLAHHYIPYLPGTVSKPARIVSVAYAALHSAFSLWRLMRERSAKRAAGDGSSPQAPQAGNSAGGEDRQPAVR